MSHYQSRADRSDSQHRRSARSGGGTAYQRSSSGKGSGAGGQGPSAGPIPVPPSSVQPAPVHSSKRSGGSNGQTRTHGTGITEVPENQRLQNMSSQQTQHVNNAQSGSRASNGSLSRSSKPGISSTTSSETAPVIPKPEPSLSSVQPQLSFQFGSIGTFVQIPARTSSAPPNLDEQKQDLLRFQTVTVQPSKAPIPSGAQQIGPRPQGPHSGVHVQPQSHPQSIIRNQPQQTVTSMSSGVLHPPYHQQGQQHPMPVHISQPSSHLQSSPVVTSQAHIPVQAHMIPQPQQQGLVQLSYSQHALQPQLQHNGGQVLKYPQSIAGPSLMGPPLAPLPGPMQTTQMTHQMSAGLPPGMTGAPFGVVPVPNPFIPPRTSSAVKIVHPETHEELKFDFKSSKSDSFHEHVPIATAGAQGIPVGNGALHSRPTLGYAGANHHQNPYSAHQNGSYSAAMQHYYQPSPVIGNVQASAVEGPVPNKMLTVPSSSMATSKEATAGSSSVVNPSVPAPSSEATSSGKEDLLLTPGPTTSQVNESKDGPDDRAMKNQYLGVHSVPVKDAAQVVKEVKHESSVLVKDSHSVTSSNAEVRQTNKKKKKKDGPSRVNSIDGAKASKVQEVKKQGESTVLDAQKEMTNTSKSIERAENNDQRPLIEGVLPDTAALKAPEPELHHSNGDLEMDKHGMTDVSVKNEVEDGSTKESLIVEGSVSLNVSDLNVVPHTNTVHKTQGAEQDLDNNEATDRQSDACTVQTESLDSADSYGEKFDDSGLKYVPSNKATESAKPTHLQLSDVEIEVKSDQHKNDVLDVEASCKAASTEEIKIVAVSEASNEDKKTEAQVEPVQQQSNVQGQFSSNKDVSEEAPISAAPDVKPSGKKKKMKDILAKADAAGTTADLYNAYKAPQEKKQDALTPTNMVSSKAPATNVVKQVIAEEETKSSKEVDDWEDAAELPSPKVLVADDTSNKSGDRQLSKDKEGETYTRDFLLTFKEQNMELPLDFEVRPDIVELLLNPQAAFQQFAERDVRSGRMMDMQLNGGLRRGASGTFDDDRWSKQPQGPLSPLWPDNFSDMGPVNGFRPGSSQGLIPRMSPSVRSGTAAPPLVPGLIPGKPPTPGAGPGVFRTNTVDSERWQKMPGGQKGLIPSPQTSLPPVHKAEKRYEVGKISGEEELKQRQIKGILNKLTPQNFQKLFEQVKEVNIQSAVTLTGVISQIFDKALTEPTFCEMYATFCKQLAADMPEFTEDGEKVTFKRVLLNKCQEEFHRGEKEQEEASESEQDSRVGEQEEQLKAKRRMLGNIRFIGELYKKHMLTERIMHECIFKLLGDYANPEEEDLEALCKLMSTIGHMIDHPARKEHIDAYFDRMNRHSDNQKISSRIRFMLKDVIDLRRNGWQERRKVEGPKRIEEVHRDAVQERQASVAQAGRISRGPSIGTSAGRRFAAGSAESGTRGITSPLFPPNTPLGSASGTRGLQAQSSVRTPIVQDVRVEDKLLMEKSAPIPLSQRSGDEGSLTLGPQGGLGRGMSIRNQPSGSGEVRRFGPGSMPAYSGAPHAAERPITPPEKPILDRPLSASGPRPSRHLERTLSEKAPGTSNYQNQHLGSNSRPSTAPVHPTLDEEQLRKKSESALNEYFSARDLKEATLCVEELRAPTFYPTMVSTWISLSFEKGDVDRELLAKLLISLQKLEPIVLKQEQVIQGFQLIMESLEDVILDTPKAPEYLAQMLVRLISAGTLPFHQVGDMLKNADIHPNNIVLDIFGKMLSGLRQDRGERYLIDMWQSSRTQLQGFLDAKNLESSSLSDFLQDHSLQCLRMDLGHGTFNNNVQEVGAQLLQHLGKNEPALETEKWLERTIAPQMLSDRSFLQMLMTQLLKHTIPVGSEDASESDLLRKRFADYQMLLKRFGSDKEKQQQYIVAMQLYVHSIGHPAGLMTALVKALYELEIISESAIFKWAEDVHDPTVGRDMALKDACKWLQLLRDST